MRRLNIILIAVLAVTLLAVVALPVWAASKVPVYLFWGDGCPHCAKEKPFLEEMAKRLPIELRLYEVWHNEANLQKMKDMAVAMDFEANGVPVTIVGTQHWIGYTDQIGEQIEEAVQFCIDNGCPDAGAGVLFEKGSKDDLSSTSAITPPEPLSPTEIEVPLLGVVDLGGQSLLISTLLISFVDGFNPCSLWVLSMLLALTLHTGSRRKVIIIGLIFILVTGVIYALFIAGIFTLLNVISFVGWIQAVVALLALFFGAVNIKDYFYYKEGLSFTIADDKKSGIFRGIRRVMDASNNFWAMAGATVVLAAGVSLVEFSCTAGFPVLWSNLLTAQNVGVATFIGLLLLYMLVYQLDELGIFLAATFTLKASKLEEKQGRILKLIGGSLMLTLAVVMIINPALMNNLGSSLLIFGAAFTLALLILLLHRRLLPAMGIRIGTELNPKARGGSRHKRK
jgi:thiol-disulfide isomerase/thioredoxin